MMEDLDFWGKTAVHEPAKLLQQLEAFLGRFIAYPSEHARLAHTLWIAHTHFMEQWESTPRIAFLSPEPGSGKSRCLEVTEPLVPRPVHAVNTTPAYLFRKVSDPDGAPTILYDEVDTLFGPKAKDNEDVRGMLNAGHRRGAVAGRCVTKGKIVETEELPAYCAVALAGLNDLPDTIMSRSIIVRMRRRAPGEQVEPWRLRINRPEAEELYDALAGWAATDRHRIAWPELPAGIEDRNADVWEALIAVADLAGGDWPERARCSAVALVADSVAGVPSLGVLLLRDLKVLFHGFDKLPTETILTRLHELDESPWADLRGKPIDARWLSRQLAKYEVQPKVLRFDNGTHRGYDAGDLADPWSRYIADVGVSLVTSVTHPMAATPTDVTDQEGALWKVFQVTKGNETEQHVTNGDAALVPPQKDVTSVTSETATHCAHCEQPLLLAIAGRDICERCRHAHQQQEETP